MTTIVLVQVLFILIMHGFADFLLQTKDMALGKSTSNYWLSLHVFYYALGMTPVALMLWYFIGFHGQYIAMLWIVINAGLHWITDYYTSRWTKRLREQEKYYGFPSFFAVIELDQIIHYVCLFTTYSYFVNDKV